jgi:hypothetical protein
MGRSLADPRPWIPGAGAALLLVLGASGAAAQGPAGFRASSQSLVVSGEYSSSASFRADGCVDATPSGQASSSSFRMATGCGASSFIAGLPVDEVQKPGPVGVVTVVAPQSDCGPFRDVQVLTGPPENVDPGFVYRLGQVSFDLSCLPTGGTTTVTVLFHGATGSAWPPVAWHSFGPSTPGGTGPKVFYPLASVTFGTIPVPGEGDVPVAYVKVSDGGIGDDTAVDGRIVSLGGPVFASDTVPVPAVSTFGLAILAGALALAALGLLGRAGLR